jgi:hypothetical protein
MADYGFNPRHGYSDGPGQAPNFGNYHVGMGTGYGDPYSLIPPYPGVTFDPYSRYPLFIPVAEGPFPAPAGTQWHIPVGDIFGGIPGVGPFGGWADRADRYDGGVPGINIQNHLGGIGLPPGYNYLFHDEHTEIKVIRSEHPPWEFEEGYGNSPASGWNVYGGNGQLQPRYIENFMVPSNATVGKVMERFGCDNPDKKKNMIHEVVQGGESFLFSYFQY